MTSLFLSVEGVDEAIQKLATVRDETPDELLMAMDEALQPIHNETANYPPQPGYMGMKKYGSAATSYVRGQGKSQRYGASQYVGYGREGGEIIGYLAFPATYSIYLRGDAEGYNGAWMHLGVWTSLRSILDSKGPLTIQILDARLTAFVRKVMGD